LIARQLRRVRKGRVGVRRAIDRYQDVPVDAAHSPLLVPDYTANSAGSVGCMMKPMPGARRVHYGWVVAGAGFTALLASAAFRAVPGVLMVPLQEEFGWSRATISAAVAINLVVFGVSGPFSAALVERIGLRRVVTVALGLIVASAGLTVFITQPWQLYLLWGVVTGAATGAVAPVLAAMIATRWFHSRRGLVVGLLTAANSTGQLIFLPLMSHVEMAGWKWVMLVPGGAALIALPVAGLLMRDRPADLGIPPYGGTEVEPARGGAGASNALAVLFEAARTGTFWALAASFFVCGATTVGLIAVHFIPAAHDHGMPATTAAGMLAVMGILDIAGTTASGWLTDRTDPRRLLFWYYALRGLSLVLLSNALTTQSYTLVLFVAFYGLDWIATVPPTVALTARRFGPEKSSIVFGWVFTFHQLGGAVAAWGAGLVRGWQGDYLPVFLASGVLCAIAALIVLRIPRAPRRPVPLAATAPATP
jgi:predicted MFS family arabinose efflux permease